MDQSHELLIEIEEALKSDELETLQVLCEDEPYDRLLQLKNEIRDEGLRTKFQLIISKWEAEKEEKKKQYEDHIRKINSEMYKQEDNSEDDIATKNARKKNKSLRLEQKFGFPYYGTTKCLMIAYGDLNPQEQVIKTMHTNVQMFVTEIFQPYTSKMLPKPSEASLKQFLLVLFQEEITQYEGFHQVYKKVTKDANEKESELSQQDFSSDEDQTANEIHMKIETKEEKEYFYKVTRQMSPCDYEAYCQCRSVTYLQNKKSPQAVQKFLQFIDPGKKFVSSNQILELLSYILCRFVRKIVFKIIKQRNEGKLQKLSDPLTVLEVKQFGNSQIDLTIEKMKKSLKKEKVDSIAKDTFVLEYFQENFKQLIPKKISDHKKPEDIWKECKYYQKMWIQRISAQKQVDSHFAQFEAGERDPQFEYSKFILKHYRIYQAMGKSFLWKKYFSQESIGQNEESKLSKKRKLESLKN